MLESSTLFSHSSPSYPPYLGNAGFPQPGASVSVPLAEQGSGTFAALSRRLRRELRRRKVGRAYDMALEIARIIPNAYEILDVGCGNGYIAQHLAGLLGSYVLGIDVDGAPEAPINFRRFDGEDVPASDHSFEAVLFCYVLHHAQDVSVLLSEARRVLRNDGVVVVYEDIPSTRWDQFICSIHNLKWRGRTGECTFRSEAGWRETFAGAGFEIVQQRTLSRWRKLVHPVRRHLFLLRLNQSTTR